MLVLAIESSCDETAAAVVEGDGVKKPIKVHSNVVASSLKLHIKTGGVVPEVAAREQVASVVPVIGDALNKSKLTLDDVDGIAVTKGPGLVGSLLVGVETAKALSKTLNKPVLPVNHLIAHLYANWITDKKLPQFPLLGMVVSGGHTDILYFEDESNFEWVGGTRDDAAGECFDKCARILLGASYPGGPEISKAASKIKLSDRKRVLPRPMINQDNLEMSFSGLKTAVFNQVRKNEKFDKNVLADDLQNAIVEVLIKKLKLAKEKFRVKSILFGGGVVANKHLRTELGGFEKEFKIPVFIPKPDYCSDNAAMIGAASIVGGFKKIEPENLFADPSMNF